MFKALMGGGRSSSSSDVRSSSKSSRRKSEKPDKSDTRSISSRKSSRGDDRDRGLGDLSSYSPSASRSKRGPPSIAGESIASTYVTAEPEAIDDSDRYYIERTPKRRDSERESKSSRRRDQDRSDSPEREKRRSHRGTQDTLDDDLDRERDRRDRRRTQSGDPYVPPISTSMPPSAPGAQFAAEIGAPGFSQFPMQYDAGLPSADHSPAHEVPYDPHVQQQFPGQFPEQVAEPYRPPNPAGAAADYYGDQGESVEHQPGIRPARPSVLPNTQAHLMAASPSANPPPEPSSLGETGAAAAYFDDDYHAPAQEGQPPAVSSTRPPKPSKPSKPSSSGVLPAAAVGAAAYGMGGMMSHSESHSPPQHATSYAQQDQPVVQGQPMTYNQPTEYDQPIASSNYQPPSKPSHSHSFSEGAGIAATGAATGYMLGHHHHSSSPEHAPQHAFQHHEQYPQGGGMQVMQPYAPGHNNALYAGGYAAQAAHNPGFYPHAPSALAFQERQRGPMGRFVDFWRDPEAVGRFEDYTESIGVCKYCFQPGTSSVDAPRKHHYHRRRRNSPDRRSSGSSRISKVSRYNSSEDESRRRPKSKKSSSWLPGMLAGYATKSLFSSKEFDDSYSLRSGRMASSHGEEDDRRSRTSRGVTHRSGRSPQRDHYADSKHASQSGYSRHTRSRSRSSSRSGRNSYLKEAALGAAVGGAALAVAKSRNRSRSRSRSPERRQHRKDSSSSSSFVNLPRPAKKSIAGGIGSFFTASSENRKKRHTKKRGGFFSFKSGSSSSSLDNDLAFGDGFSKKLSKSKKKGKKGKEVDAALVELSDTATRLAGSSPHGPGRSAGQMYTPRSRQSNYTHSTTQDEEWIDAESEDQSSSSVSSALAFGGSSVDSSSDSASSKWGWRWGSKKDKKRKDKRPSATNAALVAGAGAIGAAAISSARHRDSDSPSRSGSLQQVYPMPTSDPSRFDVAKMSPSVSGGEPTLIRPGPIPLQQPQPFTPVSQSVYTTQGAVSGPIPVYSTPAVPPLFANEVGNYDSQFQITRDAAWAPEPSTYADRRKPRRSDSSPVFPTQETASSLKRRFTAKEQASVQFNLTEEQAERERHLIRRDKNYRDEVTDQPVQLIDREEELARQESERRERRRKERDDEERRYAGDREKGSSPWVGAAAAGAVGAAAASTIISRKTDDDEASEASQRYNERREKRRAERKRDTDAIVASSTVSRFEPTQPIDEEVTTVEHREDQKKQSPRSPRPAQVYDDYAEFYAPEELRHSPDVHRSSGSPNMPTIVEVEPASERRTQEEPEPTEVNYSYEPYQHVDRLPWPVPGLNLIEPTPPHSVTGGSVRDVTSPTPPVNKSYDTQPRERPTGSRVSWGEHETHEYEIPSSSEQDPLERDISPIEISPKDVPLPASEISQSKGIPSTSEYGADIEFAATIAAATAAAGFDPSLITDDPSYHTRTSPPGSEDEHRFTSPWSTSARKEPHGFVEREIEEIDPKSTKDMTPAPEHVVQDKDELFFDGPESFSRDQDISSGRGDKASIAQEVIEQLNGKYGKRDRTASPEKDVDVFSMPGGFDTAESRNLPDARSVVSAPAPVAMDPETPTKSKSKSSRRSGDDFEIYESREVSPSRDESYSVISAPVSKDETSKSKSRKSRKSGDDFGIAEYPESVVPESRDDSFSVISAPVSKDETSKSKSRKSRRSGDDFEIYESREPFESRDDTRSVTSTSAGKGEYDLPRSREISGSYDDNQSVFSAPVSKDESSKSRRSRRSGDDFDISRSRDVSESGDESRSVFSEPAKSRKTRRNGDDFDPRRDAEAAPDDAEGVEEKKRRRKRRSKHGSDTFSVDDDARSAITDVGDDKSERRKNRHRSSREPEFDDNASITSSPARIDESREKRRGKDEKEKSGGFLRNIFGSQVTAPAERVRSGHSRSSSLDKRSSREAISEAGVDDERRRHKKHSSKHRRSSNGDELDRYMSDKEKGTQDDTNLEEYRSSRQQKEERRRHRYEEIVDSGRKRESEKDGYSDNFDDQSFLRKHPEILAPEREDYGASWLPSLGGSAAVFAAASGLNELPQQRPRSQSTSPPVTEKTLDLTPKSLSRPASPETSHPQGSRSPKQRRHSVAKSTNESPTAVPLHFRRPPTSPGLSRAVPVEQPAPIASPGSPSQQRNRRPGSVEFRNSREIRPLWLVERHSLIKGEPETEEPLPSLPSSKTSSRAPSMDNVKSFHDDDGLKSWEHVDLSQSIMENQRPTGLTISTDQANESHDRDLDLLGSQQPTPTAEHFQDSESRKEKRRYEFHSPSELLQDPAVLDELPPSPTLDALPSAEGSMVGVGSREQETKRALDALEGVSRPQPEPETSTQEHSSFFGGVADFAKGAGFAGVVDAAAIAAVREHDQSRSLPTDEPAKAHGFSDIVDEAAAADCSSHDHDKAPVDEEAPGEPVTAIEENYPTGPEPVHQEMELAKEFAPESTEQPVESSDLRPQPDTEVVPDEGVATQSSKKKNKKKKGKKNQAQDADLGTPEELPAQEDLTRELAQDPAVEVPEVESVSAEPEVAVPEQSENEPIEASRELGPEIVVDEPVIEGAPVEPEVAVPVQSQNQPIEASRELGPEIVVDEPVVEGAPVQSAPVESAPVEPEVAVPEQPETEPIEASRELEIEPLVAAAQEPEVVTALEPEPTEVVPTGIEQADDTASSTKKAKRDKKKQKKKSKNASTSEEPADDTVTAQTEDDISASKEVEDQQVDTTPGPAEEIVPAPLPEDIATSTEPLENTSDQTTGPSAATDEEQAQSQQQSGELVEPVEQVSTEESVLPVSEDPGLPVEEQQTPEPTFTDANETPIDGATQPEAEEIPRSLEEIEKPTEDSTPEARLNDTTPEITETPKEDTEGEDNFQEAVEEQVSQPAEEKEPALEPPIEVVADAPAEGSETKAQKRKNKKKKNRKSAAVEETQISVEAPAPETESPESQGPEPEQSAVVEPVDTQSPPIGGEALLTDLEHLEQPTKDVEQPLQTTIEEPAATQEKEQVPLEFAVDATPVVTEPVDPAGSSDELSQPAVIDVPPGAELPDPAEEALHETPEPSAVETQTEVEVEAEPEVALTAAQKKKTKKNKKKGKQGESSILEDEKPTESISPAPEFEAAAEDMAKEAPLTEDVSVDAPAQERDMALPVEVEQSLEREQLPEPMQTFEATPPQEEASPEPLPEPTAEEIEPERPKEVTTAPEEQPKAEQSSAEPEVPMTAAERKKAKKAKKKQQKEQEESIGSIGEDIKPVEAEPAPEAESAEPSKDITPAAEIDDVAPADLSAPVSSEPVEAAQDVVPASTTEPEAAPVTEDTLPTETETLGQTKDIESSVEAEPPVDDAPPSSEIEATEVIANVPFASEEAIAPADAPQDLDQQDDIVNVEEPKSEDVALASTEEPSVDAAKTDAPKAEEQSPEPEVPMTAAERKKAKKNKKKQQQKQESEAEPTSTEEKSVEQTDGILPESQATPTAVDEPTDTEAARDLGTETKPEEEQAQDVPILDSELAPDAPAEAAIPTPDITEQGIDVQDGDNKTAQEHEVTSAEELQGENLDTAVSMEPVLDKSLDDKPTEPTAEPAMDEAQATEPTESPVVEQAEDEQAVTSSKSKKKKNKKRQSVAPEEEQPAPPEEESKVVTAEEEIKLTPAEEESAPVPAEVESTEPAPSQELEQSPPEKDAEVPILTEEAPKAEESTQPETPTDVAAAEAAEEASMTPAQRRKAKKDKKKRQSVAAEQEQSTPAEEESKAVPAEEEAKPTPTEEEIKLTPTEEEPAPVPTEVEPTEPALSQEPEQPAPELSPETPIATEEAPKAEETTQQDASGDVAAIDAAEEASMTPAQRRKAKKDKKKRQSVAAEQEQSTPAEEGSKAVPAEEEAKPTPTEEEIRLTPTEEEPASVPTEVEPTEPALSQEPEQPAPELSPETPIATEEAPKAEGTTQQDASGDVAAIDAAEEASMTPAQRRKAKKDKKKRQSVVTEQEQPASVEEEFKAVPAEEEAKPTPAGEEVKLAPAEEEPTPIPTEGESTESAPSQELEHASVNQEAKTPIVTEEEPKADEPSPEESTQVEVSADVAAIEAAEEASMTPAQRRKAKKDKKKRQSVVAEQEQPASVEEPKPEPAEEDVTPAPAEEVPIPESVWEEPTAPILTQEVEQSVGEDAGTPIVTEEEGPKAEEPSPEESTQPEAPADAADIEAAEEASMTPAQRRKAKKDKKKRQSVVTEQEQPASVEEPKPESPQQEPVEPGLTQETEQPTVDKDAQTPIMAEEEVPKTEEPSLEEATQQDAPADAAATEAAEEEAMTPAQKKKAKKDKKKQRKSVAFDDNATPSEEPKPEQNSSAHEDKVESQDAPAELVIADESAKELPVTEEVAQPATEGEVSEKIEEPASSEQSKEIAEDEPTSVAAPDAPIPAEVEDPKSTVELPNQPEQDAQTPSEPQSPSAQEPEVPLTGAQKKKAKKNKKKGKSVDLAENAPDATDAAQESEPTVQTSPDTPAENLELQDTPASEPAQLSEDLEQDNTTEPEAPKAEEPEITETLVDDVPKEEIPDAKETDKAPATEAIVDAEPTPSQEAEAIASSPAETTEEAGVSTKERRKAAKKAKKRQSKNVDADNDAATSTEAANSVEKVLTSTDTDAPGLSAVPASSPAEHDGKEHQSHDIETYDATAQNTASTDKYMSSQVEQTPIESPFLEYPPQPVLERSVDSGELVEGNAVQEGDVAPTAQEREGELVEPTPLEEIKTVDDGDVVEEKSSVPEADDFSMEKDVENDYVEETPAGVPIDDIPEAQTQESLVEEEASETAVSKKQKKKNKNKNKNKKQEDEAAAPELEPSTAEDKEQPEAAALFEAEPQPEVKEITEPEPIAEAEPLPVLEEQSADHSQDIEETTAIQTTEDTDGTKEISVPEAEAELVPISEEQRAEHPQDIDDTKEINVPEGETVAPPTEETTQSEVPTDAAATEAAEEASMTPAQKRKAKKDKKKQRQSILPQEPEAELEPREQTTPEAAEASVQEVETATESAPAEIITQDEAVTSANELTVQPIDVTEDAAKDIVTLSEDTESQEIEGGERSLELPSAEPKVEEGDKPAGEAAEAPAEILNDEQASEQMPPEAGPEPEGESASVPKKMSKKEKKKAAAAAALLEEEKFVESQPEPEEPLTITPQALEEVVEQPIVQEPEALGTEDKPQPETEKILDETTELTTSEPKHGVLEQPVEVLDSKEPLESDVKPEESTKELAEEPAVVDTITRKASKKDKKKAKKQAKQEVIEPASPLEEHVPTDSAAVEAAPEPEPTFKDTPTEIVPEPESIAREEIQEAPNSELESIEAPPLEGFGIVSEDKQPSESEKNEAVVPLDTLPTPSHGETADKATNYESLDLQDPAEKNVQEDEAQVVADARDLEKTADLEVVEGSVEDGPGKPEVMPALSKKMSKKDKRKAKKNGSITEEVSTQQQEEPQADVAELPTEWEIRPIEPAAEQEIPETEDAAEPQPTLERELPIESSLAIEDQPISAPEVQVGPTQPDEEQPVSEETLLSRSKKKAKKAQKANKSLDTERAKNAIDADQHANIVPFEEDQSKAQDLEMPDEKSSHDEEDWPAIDWQAKFEESQRLKEVNSDPEPEIPPPEPEIISEFVDSSFPEVSHDANEAAPEVEEPSLEPSNDKEIEPPARTTTPGGSKIANLFPGLERAGFRRSALDQQTPSLKDGAEEETTAGLEANRDIAIPVSEAPLATTETKEIADDFTSGLPSSLERQIESTISELKAHSETPTATEDDSIREPELPMHGEKSLDAPLSLSTEPSNERTRTEEPSSPTRLPPREEAGAELCELRRSPSIHGRHQHTPRTWSLDEPSLPALAPSPPRSLFGPTDDYVRPRTPLEPIAEQVPHGQGTMAGRGTPRLEMKPEHVLPRPQTPVRKFTDNAFDREAWPTENQKSEDFKEIQKTPEQGILKPSTSSGKLRRTNRSISGDLRAASRALDSQPSNLDLDQLPSSSSYDPVTDKGKRPLRNMSDVYEGWGETPNSPRSPSRPPSVRRRRSMQHLQDIETRLDQLISENRLLIAARDEAEDKLRNTSVARRKSDRALNTRDGDLRDRESEVEQLKNSVEWLQKEMTRLTQENEGLTASNSALAAAHAAEVNTVRQSSARELVELQSQHSQLSSQVEDRVRQEIESALAQKDIELRRLRTELEEARDKVKELQQQIAASVHDNALVFRDEEYFEAACQKLCGHVQSWVVRFSKHSDKRRCRPLSDLQDEKIADRFDNALLDGSDPDSYLSDRVRRRDVFMSVVMTMVWEYIFTRYLFGMDREQRQKLKSLEKQLGEVGPARAVHRWRATTLTLLSRRPAFAAQRESDTEAVTLEIFQTLSRVLPPPSHVESQLLDNLRKIMRVAVSLSLEMRTQLAEFIMLPPLQPEYDTNGDLARQVYFNAALMNERSGLTNDNGELEAQQSIVRIVLFPLVVKKGNDVGEGEDEDVVCPAQVLIARPSRDKKVPRVMSGDRMSIDATRSVHSIAQSIAHSVAPSSMMDMSNVI